MASEMMMMTTSATACDKTACDMEVEALDGTLTEKDTGKATSEKRALDVVDGASKDEGMGMSETGEWTNQA